MNVGEYTLDYDKWADSISVGDEVDISPVGSGRVMKTCIITNIKYVDGDNIKVELQGKEEREESLKK